MEDNDISVSLTPEETTVLMRAIVERMKTLQSATKSPERVTSIILLSDVSTKIQEAIQHVGKARLN